jgi:hypothetical protein
MQTRKSRSHLPACACAYVQACAWLGMGSLGLHLPWIFGSLHWSGQPATCVPKRQSQRRVRGTRRATLLPAMGNTQHPTLMRALARCSGRVQRQPGDRTRATLHVCARSCAAVMLVERSCLCRRVHARVAVHVLSRGRHEWHSTTRLESRGRLELKVGLSSMSFRMEQNHSVPLIGRSG